ncbi:hypothetical protein H310_14583 [Aphanomyces invadans]|uniref:PCI domain-containing protein n=1 Tax=Aphanomyces invadans TaxID=157072 RepID=A0A024T959_9STRA|nr:hypothetical protein H310_14583 [Aphanomyces invadans]ETV90690.1 hypothetical protein H310_14583 [Aphanomyces invadans]|eukprot:XP_008880687.1 hypothetical protein H310_14583 [Aphanomyces invadans]
MNVGNLVNDVEEFLQRQQSDKVARLLAISYDGSAPINESDSAIDSICRSSLSNGYDDLVAPLLKAKRLVHQKKYADAYDLQIAGFIQFLEIFRDQNNWLVPLLQRLTYDTRVLAQHADSELSNKRGIDVTDKLANAEQNLKKGFSMTLNDRAAPEYSKKPATLYVVNQLFKIYFRLNKINLCGNVIQAINKQNFSIFDKRDQVTYMYYLGRIRMLEDNYVEANECFGFAWRHCPVQCTRNKRMILQYLVPVKLVLGVLPSPALLEQYELDEYVAIASAIKQGNLAAFYHCLQEFQVQFMQQGMYLLMQKLSLLVMRTLLKKVYLIRGKKDKVQLTDFLTALAFVGTSMDMDALECVIANLIVKNYVKGFMSHKLNVLVLSKSDPFPAIE